MDQCGSLHRTSMAKYSPRPLSVYYYHKYMKIMKVSIFMFVVNALFC